MRRHLALAPLAAVFALAACEDRPQVREPVVQAVDLERRVIEARKNLPIPLEVAGRVYPGPADVTARAVLEAIETKPERLNLRWALAGGPEAVDRGYRLVVALNGPAGVMGSEVCAAPAGGDPQAEGAIDLIVAFCRERRALATIRGRLGESDGIADPRFEDLLTTALLRLMP